jgi:CRP-like cAMP-binding protein
MHQLNLMPPWVPLATKEQMLLEIPWVVGLSTECIDLIVRHSVQVIFKEGEYITRKRRSGSAVGGGGGGGGGGVGDSSPRRQASATAAHGGGGRRNSLEAGRRNSRERGASGASGGDETWGPDDGGGSIYMISRGLVNLEARTTTGPDGERKLLAENAGVGFTIGADAILRGTGRTTDAVAVSTVVAFEFPAAVLLSTISEHPSMEVSLWRHLAKMTAPEALFQSELYRDYTQQQMGEFVRKWRLCKAESGVQNAATTRFGGFGVVEKCSGQVLLATGAAAASTH